MGSCTASRTFAANAAAEQGLKIEAGSKKTHQNIKFARMNTMADDQDKKEKNDIPVTKSETVVLQTVNVLPKAVKTQKSKFVKPLNLMELHEYATSDICCIMSSKNNAIETLVPFISLDISQSSLQQRRLNTLKTRQNR